MTKKIQKNKTKNEFPRGGSRQFGGTGRGGRTAPAFSGSGKGGRTSASSQTANGGESRAPRSSFPRRTPLDKPLTVSGTFSYSGRGFGFVEPDIPEDGSPVMPDIFISPRETRGAMSGDRVTAVVTATGTGNGGGESAEGYIKSVEYSCESIIGTLRVVPGTKFYPGYAYVTPDKKSYGVLIHIPADDSMLSSCTDGTKVEVIPRGERKFTRTRSLSVRGPVDMPYFDTEGRINNIFGSSLSREANYAAILFASDIRTEFPDEAVASAEKAAAETLSLTENRRDLRDRLILTIDGAGAKDLDDAVSLETHEDGTYTLGVHIADVSHYVRQNTPVEREARLRATSVYFTDKVVPMLPEVLSNGACSLNAGEDKYALSAEMTLTPDGGITDVKIFKSVIRSAVRGVYDEVNDIFSNPESEFREKYAAVLPMLGEMHSLYEKLRARQEAKGVLELEDSEPVIIVDENSMPIEIIRRERGDAEKLIEQFMLCANMGVAMVMNRRGLPCLYRMHEKPSEEKLKEFSLFVHNSNLSLHGLTEAADSGDAREIAYSLAAIMAEAREKDVAGVISDMMLRAMMKAKYSPVCVPHFGLGAPEYCHFTSPIRRYPDLFTHTAITAVLEGDGLDCLTLSDGEVRSNSAVEELRACAADRAQLSNEGELRALEAERAIEDLYMALFMASHIGEEFDAEVVSVIKSGMFIRCENLVEGLIPSVSLTGCRVEPELMKLSYSGHTYSPGIKLRARLTDVDLSVSRITFALITE